MTPFDPVPALLGGALIGVSASVLLAWNGRVAGVSGILGELARPRPDGVRWRAAFLAGLAVGAFLLAWLLPEAMTPTAHRSTGAVALAGVLVGLGTRLGNGCTSGHGVCGIPRGSARSIVATLTFIFTGAVTVAVVNGLFGGSL